MCCRCHLMYTTGKISIEKCLWVKCIVWQQHPRGVRAIWYYGNAQLHQWWCSTENVEKNACFVLMVAYNEAFVCDSHKYIGIGVLRLNGASTNNNKWWCVACAFQLQQYDTTETEMAHATSKTTQHTTQHNTNKRTQYHIKLIAITPIKSNKNREQTVDVEYKTVSLFSTVAFAVATKLRKGQRAKINIIINKHNKKQQFHSNGRKSLINSQIVCKLLHTSNIVVLSLKICVSLYFY